MLRNSRQGTCRAIDQPWPVPRSTTASLHQLLSSNFVFGIFCHKFYVFFLEQWLYSILKATKYSIACTKKAHTLLRGFFFGIFFCFESNGCFFRGIFFRQTPSSPSFSVKSDTPTLNQMARWSSSISVSLSSKLIMQPSRLACIQQISCFSTNELFNCLTPKKIMDEFVEFQMVHQMKILCGLEF